MKTTDTPKKKVIHNMRKRKEWRKRCLTAALRYFTWETGQEGREAAARELSKCVLKVQQWSRRHQLVIRVIQARAVAAFRQGGAA